MINEHVLKLIKLSNEITEEKLKEALVAEAV